MEKLALGLKASCLAKKNQNSLCPNGQQVKLNKNRSENFLAFVSTRARSGSRPIGHIAHTKGSMAHKKGNKALMKGNMALTKDSMALRHVRNGQMKHCLIYNCCKLMNLEYR